jgi:hypothetical protein
VHECFGVTDMQWVSECWRFASNIDIQDFPAMLVEQKEEAPSLDHIE